MLVQPPKCLAMARVDMFMRDFRWHLQWYVLSFGLRAGKAPIYVFSACFQCSKRDLRSLVAEVLVLSLLSSLLDIIIAHTDTGN